MTDTFDSMISLKLLSLAGDRGQGGRHIGTLGASAKQAVVSLV